MAFAKKDRNISLGVYLMTALSIFLAVFVFWIVASNQKFFDSKYTVYMFLPNAQGLNRGAFITLSGLKVGVVGDMQITNEQGRRGVTIELKIDRDYQDDITNSSVAMIKTLGILGDKYVDITIGNPEDPILGSEEFINSDPGVDPYEFFDEAAEIVVELRNVLKNADSLTTYAMEGRGALGKLLVDRKTGDEAGQLVSRLNRLTRQIERGEGTIGKLMQDDALYASLEHSSQNLESIMDSLNAGKGVFGQLLKDETFFPKIKSLATRTDSVMYLLQSGKGSAGALLNDPVLYQNLTNLSRSLDSLITDLKKNPGRYVKFEMF